MNQRTDTNAWADPMPVDELLASSVVVPQEFYARKTVDVARDLLGKVLVHGRAAARIVEVEAYLGLEDKAAHASRGITERTRVIFGPPGRAYVYLIYGMYECLNLVAEPDGVPGCVLIRAAQPLCGIAAMRRRRKAARKLEELARGPGRLTQALGITRAHYGHNVAQGDFTVRELRGAEAFDIDVTPRIGIHECVDWPLRFVVRGSRFASPRKEARA